jgi:hypothetical protein
MPRTASLLYFLIALLCLAAPFTSGPSSFSMTLLRFVGLPFAFASAALGASAWNGRGPSWLEVGIATLWGFGAVALCVNITAPPLEFDRVFAFLRVQGFLTALAAIALLLAAFLEWRTGCSFIPRSVQTGALLVLGVFLGRRSLMALAVLPSAGSIDSISRELWLTEVVLVGCALAILGGVLGEARRSRQTSH